MINTLLDITHVLGVVQYNGETCEVCVEGLAHYLSSLGQVEVDLRAFLRSENQEHIGERTFPSWLPTPIKVTEHVSSEEAHAMASDIFASWRRKVDALIPR